MERYVANLAPRLEAAGDQVTVIGGHADEMRRALPDSVRFVPAQSVADALRALHSIPKPHIVNTHMSDADLAGVLFGLRARKSRVVSTRHFGARRGSTPAARAVFAMVEPRIAAQIAISDFVADAIHGDSVIVHTGVENVADEPGRERERVVLLAQRLEAEKDAASAIRAWAVTRARHEGWRLRIAGDGAQRDELVALAKHLGASDSVDFLGYRADVGDLMSRSAIFLAPTPREGLGLSVLEAMARALPVVASAAGGHLETVGSVEGAAVFTPGDAQAAAAAIDALADDDVAREDYGMRLQARQQSHFGIARQVIRTREIYQETAAR